jgi:IS1 family transposase
MTAVDRATHCIVGWTLALQRPFEILQEVVEQAPHALHYYSDGLPAYADVYYHGGSYQALRDKSQTYTVEGQNAELRHYLARLHRKTRCFSKCLIALWRAVALFVHFWNRRQLKQRAHPEYRFNLIDFVSMRD